MSTYRAEEREKASLQPKTEYIMMLRKLYTVIVGLEIVAIVSQIKVLSEIQLNGP
jgi:hypothetical protein